jgi:hypothetical protein
MERFNTVVNNTASFFRFIKRRLELYESLSHQEVPEVKKPVGRPKSDNPKRSRPNSNTAYSEWIAACQALKVARKVAWDEYNEARLAYNEELERSKTLKELKDKMTEAKAKHSELKNTKPPRLEDFK